MPSHGNAFPFRQAKVDTRLTRLIARSGKCPAWVRKPGRFIVNYLALPFFVAAYAVIGAVIFQELEGPQMNASKYDQKALERQIESMKQDLIEDFSGLQVELQSNNKSWWEEHRKKLVDDKLNNLHGLYKELAKSKELTRSANLAEDSNFVNTAWDFGNALLFTESILTTVTQLGQVSAIIYSILAVPLMTIFVTNVSHLLVRSLRIVYHRGFCYFCSKRRAQSQTNSRRFSAITMIADDNLAVQPASDVQADTRSVNGVNIENVGDEVTSRATTRNQTSTADDSGTMSISRPDTGAQLQSSDDEAVSKSVPITFVAGILCSYILVGSLAFMLFEGTSFVEALYFTFVTISTIGFGDYTPHYDDKRLIASNAKMIAATIYTVFGMALLGMCVRILTSLIKEKLLARLGTQVNSYAGKRLHEIQKKRRRNEVGNRRQQRRISTAAYYE